MTNFSQIIDKIIFNLVNENLKEYVLILYAWDRVIDDLTVSKTMIKKFEKKVLFIQVCDHMWRHELMLKKKIILQKLIDATKVNIKDIKFYE
jgi:hypothetical protein